MMTFKHISLKDFMKNRSSISPTKEVIESFSKEIELFLQKAPTRDDEEFQKNEINKFLAKVYGYDCNTKGSVDSAIYIDGDAQVLIEAKALKNKPEFPKDTPLSKALYESILYFLREKITYENNSIKHIILCNPYDFYVFDATSFEMFQKDKKIKKFYDNCDGKEGTDKSTKKFFEGVEKHLKGEFEGELAYTHFCLNDNLSIEELSLIYQLLSPQVLLKARKTLDANTLNKNFYEELLYILGLQEVSESGKSGGKILIKPSKTSNTLSSEIERHYKLSGEEIFTLLTTWNNRILFLRLLESMLKGFNHIQKEFLDISIIQNFKTLQTLFFEVLAKKNNERSPSLPKELINIPYLNSSLFDPIALEREGKHIGGLDSAPLALFSRSILKKDTRFKDKEALPLLEYLFEFLHAYDFTTTPKDISNGVKQNHDRLINSAVLGLVFEKLNGYKEGSFYTPSFITSYMCKESITEALIQKYNSTYKWEASTLKDIISFARSDKIPHTSLFSTLLSLRICDPAVGSGHFLVSALNEMVLLCYELGLFTSLPLSSTLELENDEILIKTQNELFAYTRPSSPQEPSHKIQVELFNLKKSIIENCLFGVDINPNSCEITKLRLWIELLKYSYYIFDEKGKNTNALETLPNIDINIKCGNSLISYFDLNQSLTHYPNIKTKIQNYKNMVKNYKEGFFSDKTKLSSQIEELLIAFQKFCFKDKYKKEIQAFQKQCDKYRELYGNYLAKDDDDLTLYISENPFPAYEHIDETQEIHKQAKADFSNLKQAYNALYNLSSNNPFEWRFEFPEVLDEEGNFLGFDCMIGNPPYIRQELIKDLKPSLAKHYEIYKGTSDIYTYFFEKGYHLLREGGILFFITSNKWTRAGYGELLRKFILQKTTLQSYIDFNGEKVFESATVDTSITGFLKLPPTPSHQVSYLSCSDSSTLSSSKPDCIPQSSLSSETLTFSSSSVMALKEKIESIGTPLKEWDISINYGIKTGYNEAFIIDTAKKEEILNNCQTQEEREATEKIIKKMLRGRDIKRYSYEWAGLWIIFIPWHFPNVENSKSFEENEKDFHKLYPSLYSHFLSHKDMLSKRNKAETGIRYEWYCLQRWASNYYQEFEREKIVYSEIVREPQFFLDINENFYAEATSFILTGTNLKYLLGLLNNSFVGYIFKEFYAGGGLGENGYRYKKAFLERLPIPQITESNKPTAEQIIALVEEIFKAKEQDPNAPTQELESQIDSLVYTLYTLTDEEIKIIEGGE